MAIYQDPIFKGSTRPSMMFGIPFVPMILVCVSTGLAAVWGGVVFGIFAVLMSIMTGIVILAVMQQMSKKDDQRFRQMWIWVLLRLPNRNRYFWRAASYSPNSFKRRH